MSIKTYEGVDRVPSKAWIIQYPKDFNEDDLKVFSPTELINALTDDESLYEALRDRYMETRESKYDQDDEYAFIRLNAIEMAKEMGYLIHETLE